MSEGTNKMNPPEYLPTECPYCQGRVSVFGEKSHRDFSTVQVICWKCGKHSHFAQDEANQTYHQIQE